MTKIFISHASEDKVALAEPLAHALKAKYQVWYDRFELTVGDSLLGKINEGLASCDYGVVILSPAFFRKKWTRSELDGLMAIESVKRKVILPIWLNVSEDDVKKASPILAGRLGLDGKLPVDKIVDEIQRGIEVAERVSSFPKKSPAMEKLRHIAQKQEGLKNADRLAYSEEGVTLMKEEVNSCMNALREQITELSAAFPNSKFHSNFNRHGSLEIFGPYGIMLVVQFSSEYVSSLTNSVFRYLIAIKEVFREPANYLHEILLHPSFNHESCLEWVDQEGEIFSTDQLREAMLNKFIEEIEVIEKESR